MNSKEILKRTLSNLKPILTETLANHITPVETSFSEKICARELLDRLGGRQIGHRIQYIYVTGEKDELTGVLPIRVLLAAPRETPIGKLSDKRVVAVHESATVEQAISLAMHHELLALPVIDDEGRLLGLFEMPIDGESAHDGTVARKLRSREVFQMIGLTLRQNRKGAAFAEFIERMPWLTCNIIAGLGCAWIGSYFHELLSQFVVIALFIPLVLTLGESVSMQSMALSLPFLYRKKTPWRAVMARLSIEWKSGILLGTYLSLIVVFFAFLGGVDTLPMVSIGLAIFLSMGVVAFYGTLLPMVLHAFNLEPKVASGPFVLMLTDITITALYFALSDFLLRQL